jgi:hypothetical protein
MTVKLDDAIACLEREVETLQGNHAATLADLERAPVGGALRDDVDEQQAARLRQIASCEAALDILRMS